MATQKELIKIRKLAINRKATLITRLQKWQQKNNDQKCDEIYMRLQYENEIIQNCDTSLGAYATHTTTNTQLDQ